VSSRGAKKNGNCSASGTPRRFKTLMPKTEVVDPTASPCYGPGGPLWGREKKKWMNWDQKKHRLEGDGKRNPETRRRPHPGAGFKERILLGEEDPSGQTHPEPGEKNAGMKNGNNVPKKNENGRRMAQTKKAGRKSIKNCFRENRRKGTASVKKSGR